MSDDEADPELLELLRQHLRGKLTIDDEPETGVLEDAEYVYDNSIDVAIDMAATKAAAAGIAAQMEQKKYSTASWAEHELHPKSKDESTVAFIFTMDILNFSFWSDRPVDERYAVSYKDKTWTGYWSMVACLQRALDEGVFFFGSLAVEILPFVVCLPVTVRLIIHNMTGIMIVAETFKTSPSLAQIFGKARMSSIWKP
jgi:hypothetical protein